MSRHAAQSDWATAIVRTCVAGASAAGLFIGFTTVLIELTDDTFATVTGLAGAAMAALIAVAASPLLKTNPALARVVARVLLALRRAQ